MTARNLLIISNNFPNKDNSYIADIFVKEQVKYLKKFFDRVYVISPVAYGMDFLRKTIHKDYQYENVSVFFPKYLNIPFFYNYGRSVWIFLETKAIMALINREKIKFDIIHAHFTWPSGAVAVEIKKHFNVPVIITEHTHITLSKEIAKKNHNFINTLKKCDSIIRVNKKDIPLFQKLGIEKNRLHHIGNGYDSKKYFPLNKDKERELLNLPKEKKIILNIGRLSEEKGQNFLISAIAEIQQKRTDCICYIGGDGPDREKLIAQICKEHLQNKVFLIGFVPDNVMVHWMNACDIFVLPSLSESFGIVQIEAMACGKPVVATRNGGSEEIIISDDFGLLVNPGNSVDLAEKIIIALERQWNTEKIQQYAYLFTWEIISKKITGIYQQLLIEGENSEKI